MGLITKRWKVDGVLTAPTSIKLSSSDGTYGVRRQDTEEVIVADDTAMTLVEAGVYNYSFDSVAGVVYEYVVEVVYGGDTYYYPATVTFASTAATDTLLYVRTKAAKISGRYDLVDSAFGDNGMDFFINQAQKWLDQQIGHNGLKGRYVTTLTDGTEALRLERCISVDAIWLIDSSGNKSKLVKEDLHRCILWYQGTTNGTPLYWAYDVGNLAPQQQDLTDADDYYDTDTLVFSDCFDAGSIRLFPAADNTGFTLQVYGSFYSPLLVDDADKSWWTVQHPELLVYATIAEIEGALMTESSSNSWYARVQRGLFGIHQEMVTSDLSTIPVVEG